MKNQTLIDEIALALSIYSDELPSLTKIADLRYLKKVFPTTGQYDWFCAQVLYALIRHREPEQIIEVSMSSGYSTLITAMALKKNGHGVIDTFELDGKLETPARMLFERFSVGDFVNIHIGDARLTAKYISIKDNILLFLDSLHTEEFCRWFIETFVLHAQSDTLFQVHDVMPKEAKVRKAGGPPWPDKRGGIKTLLRFVLRGFQATNDGRIKPVVRHEPKKLPTYNGNEYSEAIFINTLTDRMETGAYAYLHHLADSAPAFEPRRYDRSVIARQDAAGRPFEWNEAVWLKCGAVKKAHERYDKTG